MKVRKHDVSCELSLQSGVGPSSWPPSAMNSDPVEKQSVYCYATHYYLVPVLWDRTQPPKLNPRGENHLRACFESATNLQIFVPIRRGRSPYLEPE